MRFKRLLLIVILAGMTLISAACGQVSQTTQQGDIVTPTALATETPATIIAEDQPWTLTIVHSNDTMGPMVPSG